MSRGPRFASRDVRRYIDAEIWPALRQQGFGRIRGRAAWRAHADRIDIVEFVTFSAYETQRLGLQPGSFAIELGCHLKYITNPIAFDRGEAVTLADPSISVCLLRQSLRRGYMKPVGLDRQYWPVGVEGVPIEKVLSGARKAVLGKGLEWFDQFHDPAAVYELLLQRNESTYGLWGFGRHGSPLRLYMLAYAALAARRKAVARGHMQQVLETGRFLGHGPRMRADVGLTRRSS